MREDFGIRLITASWGDGRRADALAAYIQVCDGLRDQFGVDPGQELQRLHLELLRDDGVASKTGPATSQTRPTAQLELNHK